MIRSFSKPVAKEVSMAGRYKPKHLLNFDSKGRYLLYTSEFCHAGRAKKQSHPKLMVSILVIISSLGMLIGGGSSLNRLLKGDAWKQKFRFIMGLGIGYVFFKQFRKTYSLH